MDPWMDEPAVWLLGLVCDMLHRLPKGAGAGHIPGVKSAL